jgi:hypothetical protein
VQAGRAAPATEVNVSESESQEFNLTCVECGMAIRVSRVTTSDIGELRFYADEDGIENRDFHFHVIA